MFLFSPANAMTLHLANRLNRFLQVLEQGQVTKFFILTGSRSATFDKKIVLSETDQFFCVGSDLKMLKEAWGQGKRHEVYKYLEEEARLINTIVNIQKPWASGLNGTMMGVGVGLGIHAPYRLCSKGSIFCTPETSYGGVPMYGSTFFLGELEGHLGTYLALTGRRVVGHDLLRAGLASHMVDPVHYDQLLNQIAHQNSMEPRHILPVIELVHKSGDEKQYPYSLGKYLGWSLAFPSSVAHIVFT